MELDLGLALRSSSSSICAKLLPRLDLNAAPMATNPKKRAFAAASWKDGDDDDDPSDSNASSCLSSSDEDGLRTGESVAVGWPPINSTRQRLLLLQSAGGRFCGGENRNKRVKVNMEGAAIGRKVDLSLHRSYGSLLCALDQMFGTRAGAGGDGEDDQSSERRGGRHAVTYQDDDGDWMLVGDVPWESFLQSANRLKIISIGYDHSGA